MLKPDVGKVLVVDAANMLIEFTVCGENHGFISDAHSANLADLNEHVDYDFQLWDSHNRRADMQLEYVSLAEKVADI